MKPGDGFKQLGLAFSFAKGAKGCAVHKYHDARDLIMMLIVYLHALADPLGVPNGAVWRVPNAADADVPLALVRGGASLGGWTHACGASWVFDRRVVPCTYADVSSTIANTYHVCSSTYVVNYLY